MASSNTVQPWVFLQSALSFIPLIPTTRAVLYKLVTFALLMAIAPISTYFGSLRYIWNGQCHLFTQYTPLCSAVAPVKQESLQVSALFPFLRASTQADGNRILYSLRHLRSYRRKRCPGWLRRGRFSGRCGDGFSFIWGTKWVIREAERQMSLAIHETPCLLAQWGDTDSGLTFRS